MPSKGVFLASAFALLMGSAALADTKIVPCEGPVTTIIVVRHADRAGTADSLSAAGVVRAQDLYRATKMAKVEAIYVTDTRRARDTAAAVAAANHIKPEIYAPQEYDALIKRILHDHAGHSVLVIGHSNTVPGIILAAGGPQVEPLDEKEFDGLYVVAVTGTPVCGATLVQVQYGAASP